VSPAHEQKLQCCVGPLGVELRLGVPCEDFLFFDEFDAVFLVKKLGIVEVCVSYRLPWAIHLVA
jgi:hypothetical protein